MKSMNRMPFGLKCRSDRIRVLESCNVRISGVQNFASSVRISDSLRSQNIFRILKSILEITQKILEF